MKLKPKLLSIFESKSSQQTVDFAYRISEKFKKGDLILLVGSVGSGKTTFLNGVLRYLGSEERVISSSFVLITRYKAKKSDLIHCDFYRTEGKYPVEEIIDYLYDAVVAIEWPYSENRYLRFKPFVVRITVMGVNDRKIEVLRYE